MQRAPSSDSGSSRAASDSSRASSSSALVVKASIAGSGAGLARRITFPVADEVAHTELLARIAATLSLPASEIALTYTDDDGDLTLIETQSDLVEALSYFRDGQVGATGCTMRIAVRVDYSGPSLSDTDAQSSYRGPASSSASESRDWDGRWASERGSSSQRGGGHGHGRRSSYESHGPPHHPHGPPNHHPRGHHGPPFHPHFPHPPHHHPHGPPPTSPSAFWPRRSSVSTPTSATPRLDAVSDELLRCSQCEHSMAEDGVRFVCASCGPLQTRPAVSDDGTQRDDGSSSQISAVEPSHGFELCRKCAESDDTPDHPHRLFARVVRMDGTQRWEEDVGQAWGSMLPCSVCQAPRSQYSCLNSYERLMCEACFVAETLAPALVVRTDSRRALGPKHARSRSDSLATVASSNRPRLRHRDVLCDGCGFEIVGPRYHCSICRTDFCEVCEASDVPFAASPGKSPSTGRSHSLAHVLLKVHLPVISDGDVDAFAEADMQAHHWHGRPEPPSHWPPPPFGPHPFHRGPPPPWGRGRGRREPPQPSVFLINAGGLAPGQSPSMTALTPVSPALGAPHAVQCRQCHQLILGTRYACAMCSSAYDLCSTCEPSSARIHDPTHAFVVLPRPVQRPFASAASLIPPLVSAENASAANLDEATVTHVKIACDNCLAQIRGPWFRCGCCESGYDLCGNCFDTVSHDPSHAFVKFKRPVDFDRFREVVGLDGGAPRALLPHPPYDEPPSRRAL